MATQKCDDSRAVAEIRKALQYAKEMEVAVLTVQIPMVTPSNTCVKLKAVFR